MALPTALEGYLRNFINDLTAAPGESTPISTTNAIWDAAGAPDNAVGIDGDWWIDLSTYDLYGPKASGAWPESAAVSLVGPAGPTGATGATGAAGPAGVAGTNGADGLGVPAGGTTGQVLAKASNADNDTEWVEQTGSQTVLINSQTGTSYTLQASDNGGVITCSNASAITLTVPSGLDVGFNCLVIQLGSGQVTFTASSTTIYQRQSLTKTAGQYAVATLVAYVANTFALSGDLA